MLSVANGRSGACQIHLNESQILDIGADAFGAAIYRQFRNFNGQR